MKIARSLSVALSLTGCAASFPRAVAPPSLEEAERPLAVVTITRVKPPWYATRGLIIDGFRRSVPEYQAIAGLERKSYTIAEADGFFGGVYLWSSEAAAQAWFSPAWFARVKKRSGVDGEVRTVKVTRVLTGAAAPVEEGDMVVAIAPGSLDHYRGARGLRCAMEGEGRVISVWLDRASAEAGLAGLDEVERFASPLALVTTPSR